MSLIKRFLGLSKTERYGMWVLLVLVCLYLFSSLVLGSSGNNDESYDFSEYKNEILSWEQAVAESDSLRQQYYLSLDNPSRSSTQSKLKPFDFDPNELSREQWLEMGLNEGQVKSILKFRSKGGVFKSKADFKKMYVISDEEFSIMEPFILLPDTYVKKQNTEWDPDPVEEKVSIEINSADTAALQKVKGIGPVFATRIVRYREKLGGFVDVQQLTEVKGIDSTNFNSIAAQVYVNPYAIRKVRVNEANINELSAHPYISYNIALSLINYRKQHGRFEVLTDIKNSLLVTDEVYEKISPYLTVR
ncbi:MAG: hypothetical protein C0592_07515 [Marinilabiliales bacterium]|nr:MAG: hypothetical protein C0592_07515 [Marinilabiliales bacterium]